ncbi:PRC-barrel domain-containing protein [Aneurinibacillus sp. REN35]|uniref:PRC-barrel domain-containing protein n=1 Tax=Aneurinibacillus sp. REN35 TaxID=3237286 RepID=UPI003528F580
MQRVRDVIGLPVIELEQGNEVGYVQDLLFDAQNKLVAVLLGERSFLKDGQYVPAEAVHAIGTDCVAIAERQAIVYASSLPPGWTSIQTGAAPIQGKTFVTSEGKQLGFVEDVYFQVESGKIVGYELSNGLLSDIVDGRTIVHGTERLKMGEDAVIVSVEE